MTTRRDFIAALSAAAAASGVGHPELLAAPSRSKNAKRVAPYYFDVNATYSSEQLAYLYMGRHLHRTRKFFDAQVDALSATRNSVFFYWDDSKKKLTNPYNLSVDSTLSKDKSYTISADVLNFHPSSTDVNDIWSQLDTNLQITFNTQAVDQNGDLLTSITMAGLNFAQDYLGGKDGKLLSIPSDNGGNNLTDFTPSEQVQITNGEVDLTIGLAGQKKKSFWDDLLTIFKQVANSPVFGLLPIPKLYQTAANTIGTLLTQVEKSNNLVQVLDGKKLQFKIFDTSHNPFVLRSGFWLILDAQAASSHIDPSSRDIEDLALDIPGQLYELVDKQGQAVDITYSVIDLTLPEIKKTPSS